MNIPFVDLKSQYAALKPDMDAAIQKVIDRTAFIMGSELDAFEKAFASFIGTKHAIGVNSGTDALHLALAALGVGPGDEVITVADTYIATCEAISHAGAKVVLVDVNPQTYNMDYTKIEKAITAKTKVILPVHLYGQPAEMDPIIDICNKHKLYLVEDCAQAHGSKYKGRKAGTFGDIACFSFYPGKNLGAYGDGGAILTNSDVWAEKINLLHNHGQKVKYEHLIVGYCHRLDNLQAAILGVKLPHLDSWNALRRNRADLYSQNLKNIPGIIPPKTLEGVEPVYHLYVIEVGGGKRDALQAFLGQNGVSTGLHYPIPVHLQKAYAELGHKAGDFPVSEKLASCGLSLPMFAELSDEMILYACGKIREFMTA